MSDVVRFVGLAVLASLLTACGGADNTRAVSTETSETVSPPSAATEAPAASAAPPSADGATSSSLAEPPSVGRTRWVLSESQLATPATDDVANVRLEFRGDTLSANSGCNLGNGTFRFEGDVLVLGAMATTRRACLGAAAAYEAAFFAFLGSRPHARLEADGDELVLESTQGANAGTLRFRAQPMPSANALQKFVYVASTRVPCTGVSTVECLQVRESTNEPWRAFHGEIVGFTPELGIEYRLRVLEEPVSNPPTDASSKRWYLDLVVEQRVVTP